jgi:SAM-dependent methyltransferase
MRAPSASRKKSPILEALKDVLPSQEVLLEIGCGTSEHAVHFAAAFPGLSWLPSDPDAAARISTEAWIAASGLPNLAAPLNLDVAAERWEAALELDYDIDAILSLNMIHIAPWEASIGLFAGAGRLLNPGGLLILYGPFMRGGLHNAASNAAFDASLKARDARWGVRDILHLERLGDAAGMTSRATLAMPANNLILVFEKI